MNWKCFPIDLAVLGTTEDSMSFENICLQTQVEIPIGNHVGAFGVKRKHDIHKGIDLYCPEDTPVYAIEDGTVILMEAFTGVNADCPWWEETEGIYIRGESGIFCYGEIKINPSLRVGDEVEWGTLIGNVRRVLKTDKGRPMTMLHLAYKSYMTTGIPWKLGEPQPDNLLDPTPILMKAGEIK